jgi:hypothetical protein
LGSSNTNTVSSGPFFNDPSNNSNIFNVTSVIYNKSLQPHNPGFEEIKEEEEEKISGLNLITRIQADLKLFCLTIKEKKTRLFSNY